MHEGNIQDGEYVVSISDQKPILLFSFANKYLLNDELTAILLLNYFLHGIAQPLRAQSYGKL